MATRSASRHRSIPVAVKVERRPRPAKTPTSPAATQPLVIEPAPSSAAWTEAHRRRIMWISVGIGTLVIVAGWLSLFSAQLRGTAPTFFGDVTRAFQEIRWPWERAPVPPSEQEIRQLEEQVFPQFQ